MGVVIIVQYARVFTVVDLDLRGGFDQMFFATHNLMGVSRYTISDSAMSVLVFWGGFDRCS